MHAPQHQHCDAIVHWWTQHGRRQYPDARRILLLCDGVGSRLQSACVQGSAAATGPARLGLEIRVEHYPPYGSKHNPIEHRLFAPVTRACQGGVFHTVDIAKKFMAKIKTSTGLKVLWLSWMGVTQQEKSAPQTSSQPCASPSTSTCRNGTTAPHHQAADSGTLLFARS
jgi:hypothetical protein